MVRCAILVLISLIASAMPAQDAPKLLTKTPNLVSAARPEVNAGFLAKLPVLQRPPAINRSEDLSDWVGAYKVEKAFMPFIPVDKGDPKFRIDAYMAWGRDGLYIALEVFTDPKQIVGSLQARDRSQSGQDTVSILVDPQGKGSNGVILSLNSKNVQTDSSFNEGGVSDSAFDMIWDSGTAITDRGWIAKIRVPFSSLRRAPGDWLVLMWASATRDGKYFSEYYPQAYLDVNCTLCQAQKLANAPVQNESNTLMVAPRLYQARTESLAAGTLRNPSVENKNGMDFRYQATRFGIEGTYNPDFATIEADVDPLQINNRFRYLYPEKRPFMMSGIDVFGDFNSTWFNFLATRSIIEPDFGVKGYGQAGRVSWGLLQARDLHGGDSIASDGWADTNGRKTSDTVLGASVGFGDGATFSKLALAAADRELLGGGTAGYSRAYGLSYYQQLGSNWSANFQGMRSDASLPSVLGGELPRSGFGTNFALYYQYGNFFASASNTNLSPDLRLDSGWIGLPAFRDTFLNGTYTFRNKGWWQSFTVGTSYERMDNWDGTPLLESGFLILSTSLTGPTSISLTRSITSREWWLGELFEKDSTNISVTYAGLRNQFAQARFTLAYRQSNTIDYARVAPSREKNPQVSLTVNAGPLYLNAQWQDRAIYDRMTGELNIRATRLFLYLEQILPHDFFWRVQYQPIKYIRPLETNPWLDHDTSRATSLQCLVGWRPNPFSGFYFGWNGQRGTVPTEFNPRNEQMTGKGLFAKATYAFTF